MFATAIRGTTRRQRMAGLLLLFGTGTVGAFAFALISGGGSARPVADAPPSGTGIVVGASPSPSATAAPQARGVFFLAGNVKGLVPGARRTLPITVTNPNPYPIHVLTVDTGVAVPAGTTCPAGTLTVGDYRWDSGDAVLTAPAGGAVRVDVPVELRDSLTEDQTACRTTTFALTFDATAQEAAS
jgi:hypothetical protein